MEILRNLFFDALPAGYNAEDFAGGAIGGGVAAALMGFLFVILLIAIALYIYTSFAFMKIGKKGGYPTPGIAWIPGIGPALITASLAKMHWWPILLIIGAIIPFIGFAFSIAFAVFYIIWTWKMFENFGKPGWIAILFIIPLVGGIIQLVMYGILAWGDSTYAGGPKDVGAAQVKSAPKN